MTKEQIVKFVKKVTKCKVKLVFHNESRAGNWEIYVKIENPKIIHIHLPDFNVWPENFQKQALLHEIGHTRTLKWLGKDAHAAHEFYAQTWGITRARRLGWELLSNIMKQEMEKWSRCSPTVCSNWHSDDWKYVRAGVLAKKLGII